MRGAFNGKLINFCVYFKTLHPNLALQDSFEHKQGLFSLHGGRVPSISESLKQNKIKMRGGSLSSDERM